MSKKTEECYDPLVQDSYNAPEKTAMRFRAGWYKGNESVGIRIYILDWIEFLHQHCNGEYYANMQTIADTLGVTWSHVRDAVRHGKGMVWREPGKRGHRAWKALKMPLDTRRRIGTSFTDSSAEIGGHRDRLAGAVETDSDASQSVVATPQSKECLKQRSEEISSHEAKPLTGTSNRSQRPTTENGGEGQPPGGGDTGPTRSTGQGLAPGVGKKPYSLFGDNPIPVRSRRANSGQQEVDNG